MVREVTRGGTYSEGERAVNFSGSDVLALSHVEQQLILERGRKIRRVCVCVCVCARVCDREE